MGERSAARIRPLARSLDPLPGESLGGYLLRLARRLRIAPIHLARITGCIATPRTTLSRGLLLTLDIDDFARATRLSREEAKALTIADWARWYPPIAKALSPDARRPDSWLFNHAPGFCPRCLTGDASSLQQQYGGPWKKEWQLPVSFACLDHRLLLHNGCSRDHPHPRWIHPLIAQGSDDTLHPLQCRQPGHGTIGRRGVPRPPCGERLDQLPDVGSLSPETLKVQGRILYHLSSGHSAKTATRFFSDLRVLTTLLCAAWPLDRHMIEPIAHTAVAEHVRALDSPDSRSIDKPPNSTTATAALLTAAAAVLDDDTRQGDLLQLLRESRTGRPSQEPWVSVFRRHAASCSSAVSQAIEPFTGAFRRTSGPHSSRAPAPDHGYRAEHIPAFLEQTWYLEHLAPLEPRPHIKTLRRFAAAQLVQRAVGGSIGAAAHYLGFNPAAGQYAPPQGLYQWLTQLGHKQFEAALHALTQTLGSTTDLINYQRRRTTLRNWYLPREEWQYIIEHLPPVPGPFQPVLDDRKRQEASAIIWAHITQGEPRFAPRRIEAQQPADVRRDWQARRGATGFQLTRTDPVRHYAALRPLLIQHANDLARTIDDGARL